MSRSVLDRFEELVYGFMMRCFIGAPPPDVATADERAWVFERLVLPDDLEPAEVSTWSTGKQRALYDVLFKNFSIARLYRSQIELPREVLRGSTESRLALPCRMLLETVRDSPLI